MRETWVRSLGWEERLEKRQLPTPVFWPREFHGLYGVAKSQTRLGDFYLLLKKEFGNKSLAEVVSMWHFCRVLCVPVVTLRDAVWSVTSTCILNIWYVLIGNAHGLTSYTVWLKSIKWLLSSSIQNIRWCQCRQSVHIFIVYLTDQNGAGPLIYY